MATTTVKSTFSLDVDSSERLQMLAQAWGVNKSEALRRAIRHAPATVGGAPHPARALLARLHADGRRSPAELRAWARRVRAERKAASSKRESRTAQARRAT